MIDEDIMEKSIYIILILNLYIITLIYYKPYKKKYYSFFISPSPTAEQAANSSRDRSAISNGLQGQELKRRGIHPGFLWVLREFRLLPNRDESIRFFPAGLLPIDINDLV